MLGRNPGWVTTQGELLADLLSSEGYEVRITSTIPSRVPRLFDMLSCLIRWSRFTDVAIVSIFSGKALVIAEIATWLLQLLNKPIVLVLRGGAIPEALRKHPRWMRRVLQRGCIVVIERYPFRKREYASPRLLWMRTFHEAYNPEMAVDVLVDLKRSMPEATLTMAGQEKGLLESVRKASLKSGIDVRFAGFLNNDGKQREFASHDIFLNTNRIDNMPVSLLEAASFGLPIVSTDVGGIPDVFVHEETALLVGSDDAPAMADAVRRLLNDPDLCAHLSENARRLAESCSWSVLRHRWHDVLARASSSRKRTDS